MQYIKNLLSGNTNSDSKELPDKKSQDDSAKWRESNWDLFEESLGYDKEKALGDPSVSSGSETKYSKVVVKDEFGYETTIHEYSLEDTELGDFGQPTDLLLVPDDGQYNFDKERQQSISDFERELVETRFTDIKDVEQKVGLMGEIFSMLSSETKRQSESLDVAADRLENAVSESENASVEIAKAENRTNRWRLIQYSAIGAGVVLATLSTAVAIVRIRADASNKSNNNNNPPK
jgi:hypothetical protein